MPLLLPGQNIYVSSPSLGKIFMLTFFCLGKWPRIDDNHGPCLHHNHRRSGHRNQEKCGRTCQHVEKRERKTGDKGVYLSSDFGFSKVAGEGGVRPIPVRF
jgi:hypothetical protein